MPKTVLKNLGYTDHQIEIILANVIVSNTTDEYKKTRFGANYKTFKEDLKMEDATIRKVTTREPNILIYGEHTILDRVASWIKLGLSLKECITMIIRFPSAFTYDIETIKKKIDDYIKYGFKKEDVLVMQKKYPPFLTSGVSTILKKADKIREIGGYTKDQVMKMMTLYPQLIGIGIEKIRARYNIFVNANYSKEEIILITTVYPTIYCNSDVTLTKKLAAIAQNDLKQAVLDNPRRLIQSAELVCARAKYYDEKKDVLPVSRVTLVYANSARFKRHSNMTNKELLREYGEKGKKIA